MNTWSWEQNILKSKETELFNRISLSCLITGNITRNIKKKCSHVENIASMLQPKVLRTNESSIYFYDSSNAILNNNQVLYNNPTSVVETNSSEKK